MHIGLAIILACLAVILFYVNAQHFLKSNIWYNLSYVMTWKPPPG